MSLEEKRALLATLLELRRAAALPEFPLSPNQEAIWLLSQLDPESPAYHVVTPLRILSPVDRQALAAALREAHHRHAILGAALDPRGGAPVWVREGHPELPLRVIDARGAEGEELRSLALAEARAPFDLQRGPFARAALITTAPADHVLVLTFHHLVVDGASTVRIVDELFEAYGAFASGGRPALPPVLIDYPDFVDWQARLVASPEGERLRAFWLGRLAGELPILDLPRDGPVPPNRTLRGSSVPVELDEELSRGVARLAAAERVTPYVVLLAVYDVLLYRHTGVPDVVVGTPFSGRTRPGFEGVVGPCLNPLPLRTDLSGNPTLRELLGRVRETVAEALDHQDYPFPLLVRELVRDRDASRSPVFQAVFNLFRPRTRTLVAAGTAPGAPEARLRAGGLLLAPYEVPQQEGQFELALELFQAGPHFSGTLRYADPLVPRRVAELLARRFRFLLGEVLRDPEQRIGDVALVPEEERARARRRPAAVRALAGAGTRAARLEEAFARVVASQPGATAVRWRGRSWSYAGLAAAVDRVRRTLRARAPGAWRVALVLPTDPRAIAGALGALSAGCAYVPLETSQAPERLHHLLRTAGVEVALFDPAVPGLDRWIAEAGATPLPFPLDAVAGGEDGDPTAPDPAATPADPVATPADAVRPSAGPPRAPAPDDLAYVLFTSGSTGRPKGVMQSHRNVLRHIRNYATALGLGPDDRLSLLAAHAFDAAIMDVYGALTTGATLCIYDLAAQPLHELPRWIEAEGITVLHCTPTLFRALAAEGLPARAGAVRYVVFGGEELARRDVELALEAFPRAVVVNGYGPSESTLAAQYFVDRTTELVGTGVPIGSAVDGIELLLLDDDGRPTPVAGEIGIRGSHIALGYLGAPELDARSFLPDPDGGDRRIYRSGDLGRLRPDGLLEFVGRRAGLVKIRGFRIELAEVEAALVADPAVAEAAVLPATQTGCLPAGASGDRLVAFVVPARRESASPGPLDSGALREALARALPAYMLPARFVVVEAIPRTPNGKVDRHALAALDPGAGAVPAGSGAPETWLESLIARIWRELLELDAVGMDDNFYDLGGHSMLALRAVARIEAETGVRIDPRELTYQTARQLAESCAERMAVSSRVGERRRRGVRYRILRALGVGRG